MKKILTKKTVSMLLASCILAAPMCFTGCAILGGTSSSSSGDSSGSSSGTSSGKYVVAQKHSAPEEVYALTFPEITGENIMPVGSYSGPHADDREYHGKQLPSMVSDEYFELYKEMGLNYFTATLPSNSAKTKEFLELCDEYGMGAFISFPELVGESAAPSVTTSTLETCLSMFDDYKSVIGFYLRDEPGIAQIKKLKNTTDCLANSRYAGVKYAYGNALPDYAPPSAMWNDPEVPQGNWEAYLRFYLENLNFEYLSFDFYPWHINPATGEEVYNSGYIKALSVSRKVANEFKIPVWSCKQCGSIFEHIPMDKLKITPDENKFRWQMSIDLAYGVKGITYFLLCGDALGPSSDIWQEGIDDYFGIFNAYTGQPNIWFDYIKEFDKHLTKIEKILMQSYHDGIIINGAVKEQNGMGDELIKEGSYYELESITGDTSLTGCYNYNGKTVLYVTNNSYSKDAKVTLNFKDNYGYTVIQKNKLTDKAGKTLDLNLLPGEGAMVVLKYS